jgi:hypothetical protein
LRQGRSSPLKACILSCTQVKTYSRDFLNPGRVRVLMTSVRVCVCVCVCVRVCVYAYCLPYCCLLCAL